MTRGPTPPRPVSSLTASRRCPEARALAGWPLRLPVTLVGHSARRALAAEPAWRVFAVFRRSFYCRGEGGALILVGRESLGPGPLHLLWGDGAAAGGQRPVEGMPVGIERDGARSPGTEPLTLDLREAREWTPPAPPHWSRSSLRRSLAWLGRAAGRAPAEGLGRLVAPVASGTIDRDRSGRSTLQRLARPAVTALSTWIRGALAQGRTAGSPPDTIGSLIGLGPGLTPSGDDVLAGALIALHGLARADAAKHLATWLHPRMEGRTGLVSRAHLDCAARGAGAAVLHGALAALASGDVETLAAATTAVGTLGHCSGWDGMVGIAVVAEAWLAGSPDDRGQWTSCR